MDRTERKITKISRTAQRFTSHVLKDFGLGTSEYELIHCVRHNPGISQAKISEKLKLDKAAVARCVAGLIKKDYLVTQPDPQDKRGKMVFATAKSEIVKNSKSDVESFYYEWLTQAIDEDDFKVFLRVLDIIYLRSKNQRQRNFQEVLAAEEQRHV